MNIKSFLYLCNNIPLDPNYEYTLDFDDLTAQNNYFDSKISNTLAENDNYSYIRKDEEIKVYANVDDLYGANYLYFVNDTKRYYAFITEKRYVSETCTAIKFKIDVMQTFMFDYQLKESFIDREHQDRVLDYSGTLKRIYNTELENVDVGTDYEIEKSTTLIDGGGSAKSEKLSLYWIEILTTQPVSSENFNSSSPATFKNSRSFLKHRGYNTGLYCYLIPMLYDYSISTKFYTIDATGVEVLLSNSLKDIAENVDACVSIRLLKYCPVSYAITKKSTDNYLITFANGYQSGYSAVSVNNVNVAELNNDNFGGADLSGNRTRVIAIENIEQSNENMNLGLYNYNFILDFNRGYLSLSNPSHNNLKNMEYESKLYTYPYNYISICDYQSEPLKLKREYINASYDDTGIVFRQSIGILPKSKLYYYGYNKDSVGKEYNTINNTLNELPQKTNAYLSYMAQNKAMATSGVAVNIGGAIANLGLGLATGGLGLAVAGSQAIGIGSQIANQVIKMQDLKSTPDSMKQSGNNAEFDFITYNLKYRICNLSIKEQFKDKLYNYFYHYGYKVNNFKTPNLRSRYYFNYIKTIGANIDSNIDIEYITELKRIYDNGITIWHYRQDFKGVNNFDYENAEMTMEV